MKGGLRDLVPNARESHCAYCGCELLWHERKIDGVWEPLDPGNLSRHACREKRLMEAQQDFKAPKAATLEDFVQRKAEVTAAFALPEEFLSKPNQQASEPELVQPVSNLGMFEGKL